jgi:hypothetical protein
VIALGLALSWPVVLPHFSVTASACTSVNQYWYAETFSSYGGGTDGAGAAFNDDTSVPYVCDDTLSHTVESVALYLPFGHDLIENGVDRGVAGASNGSCTCPSYYHFFQFAATGGTTTLSVEGQGESYHAFKVQEVVQNGGLYAQFTTDVTMWTEMHLPSGDNPGHSVVVNGEVYGDKTDFMGPGDEPALWTSPLYHAGTWKAWTNKNVQAANYPYCNYDVSVGSTYKFEDTGPLPSGGQC